ncbi:MAG: TlyA family RNA methyltransferase [Acidobacteria bacterium]|nr:TlyA family RNA methyltransferase [Acidobacteriota bacterium]
MVSSADRSEPDRVRLGVRSSLLSNLRERPLRLDQYLVRSGYFRSREQARRAVEGGAVSVAGTAASKPSHAVPDGAAVEVRGVVEPFVSRAGRKLAAALDAFAIDPRGRVCLDVGASTGGFTDCLLQRGATRVYAVDVGHDQLAPTLRADPRVVSFEGVNARRLPGDLLPEAPDLATFDLSFISVLKVVPSVLPVLAPGAELVILLKPQFEVGPAGVGKGGVVRDAELRRRVVAQRLAELEALGLEGIGCIESPVPGMSGNRESLVGLRRPREDRA